MRATRRDAIDASEKERGTPLGKPRVKLLTWNELLAAAGGGVEISSRAE